jgi:hypothetical protein
MNWNFQGFLGFCMQLETTVFIIILTSYTYEVPTKIGLAPRLPNALILYLVYR